MMWKYESKLAVVMVFLESAVLTIVPEVKTTTHPTTAQIPKHSSDTVSGYIGLTGSGDGSEGIVAL
jgi:hypothetical protein